MSIAPAERQSTAPAVSLPAAGTPGRPRVRQLAREAAALMVFSALTSVAVAAVFLLLAVAARQA